MAGRDYILCKDCGCKVIYDGDNRVRDRLEELWGDPDADTWTVKIIRCKPCFDKHEKEFERLKENNKWLECLEAAGVDNWQGFDEARELFHE